MLNQNIFMYFSSFKIVVREQKFMTTLILDYEHNYKDIIILHSQPYNMEPIKPHYTRCIDNPISQLISLSIE